MIKKLVLVFIVIFAIEGHSQQTATASPYSYYGIGTRAFRGTVENSSMGGLSIYSDSIHVNLRNPASYGGENLKSWGGEGRPVKYTIGGQYQSAKLKSETDEGKTSAASVSYVAMAIPIQKFGFGFGILPYTSVGYRIDNVNSDGNLSNRFKGLGGVNKVFLGFGYQVTKELSLGVDFNYNFGSVQNSVVVFQYDGDVPTTYQTREYNRSDIGGFNVNFGATYKKLITPRLEVVSSLTFSPDSNLSSDNQRVVSSIEINSSSDTETVVNTVVADLKSLGLDDTEVVLPSQLAFGVGVGQPRSWFLGVEYTAKNSSNFSNILYPTDDTTYENGSRLSIGGFYIPQYNSFTSYYKRMVYRAGLRFDKTGLNVNGEPINEFGISFGTGLPVGKKRLFSNANLGLEFGNRGTTDSNLIQENFINFQISLSLNDRWFQKRKYD